ncbi:hypothetical protein [Croceitalea sp. P059]|uniref:hypothetical protein n=1 Tax=Croceitalea sp. P059 TaxID=3075601 RepID=UPI002885F7A7|nr:hypothetical protein [Croceitalea sp. P059]MDT0539047.1 hypothetical protein [Croceitalea sp. P059]
MDILYILTSIFLVLFMVLATYDGFYLHLWKYKLYQHNESNFEHKTHTVRAILFPIIVWSLLIENSLEFFVIGMVLTFVDLIVLGFDAYSEKDSRDFMGGLPRWEYIIHLFANGFHYAIIALTIGIKLSIEGNSIYYITAPISTSLASNILTIVAENAIPGAVILAFLHVFLLFQNTQNIWDSYRNRITCC